MLFAHYTYRLYLFMTPSSSSPSAIRSDDEIFFFGDTTNLVDGAKALHESMTIAADVNAAIMKRMMLVWQRLSFL